VEAVFACIKKCIANAYYATKAIVFAHMANAVTGVENVEGNIIALMEKRKTSA
jgi:hypothetical protein